MSRRKENYPSMHWWFWSSPSCNFLLCFVDKDDNVFNTYTYCKYYFPKHKLWKNILISNRPPEIPGFNTATKNQRQRVHTGPVSSIRKNTNYHHDLCAKSYWEHLHLQTNLFSKIQRSSPVSLVPFLWLGCQDHPFGFSACWGSHRLLSEPLDHLTLIWFRLLSCTVTPERFL